MPYIKKCDLSLLYFVVVVETCSELIRLFSSIFLIIFNDVNCIMIFDGNSNHIVTNLQVTQMNHCISSRKFNNDDDLFTIDFIS